MHNIEHYVYSKNVNKQKVQKELDDYVAHADWQEGCTGLFRNIRWMDNKIYDSEQEAYDAIEKLDNGNYDQIAVLFYSPIRNNDSKLKELEQKEKDAIKEMNRRGDILYAQTVTSAYIGCKNCGSKLARKYLRTNACPVCSTDLRPEHMRASYLAAQWKWIKAKEDIVAYVNKHSKKDVRWLVKIEFHT